MYIKTTLLVGAILLSGCDTSYITDSISDIKDKDKKTTLSKKIFSSDINELNKRGSKDQIKLDKANAQVKKIQKEEALYFKNNPKKSSTSKKSLSRKESAKPVVAKKASKVEYVKSTFVAGSETVDELNKLGEAGNAELKRKNNFKVFESK